MESNEEYVVITLLEEEDRRGNMIFKKRLPHGEYLALFTDFTKNEYK